MADFQQVTKSGQSFYHVTSAFQKSVRRCVLSDALYFGTELYISGYAKYVWNRMLVISSEDIGLADNDCSTNIYSMYVKHNETSNEFDKKNITLSAIIYITNCKKSRLIDNITCEYFFLPETIVFPTVNMELLKYDNPIKSKSVDLFGSSVDYTDFRAFNFDVYINAFYCNLMVSNEECSLYFGVKLFEEGFHFECFDIMNKVSSQKYLNSNPTMTVKIDNLSKIFKILLLNKNAHKPERLHFVHAILLICRTKSDNKEKLIIDNCFHNVRPTVKIPDYALDMHTREGKAKGRGTDFFYKESAKITNENLEVVPDEYSVRDRVWNKYTIKEKQDADKKSNSVYSTSR